MVSWGRRLGWARFRRMQLDTHLVHLQVVGHILELRRVVVDVWWCGGERARDGQGLVGRLRAPVAPS